MKIKKKIAIFIISSLPLFASDTASSFNGSVAGASFDASFQGQSLQEAANINYADLKFLSRQQATEYYGIFPSDRPT